MTIDATATTEQKYEIYLAGGWFSDAQREALDECRQGLTEVGLSFYDPQQMCLCPPDAKDDFANFVLNENKQRIQDAILVYASITGRDLGTSWELGYALALGKRVHVHIPTAGGWPCKRDALNMQSFDFASKLSEANVYVCDTTAKDPVRVATAGYAAAIGKPVVYYAPGLPEGAMFNLMLARSGAAVCTHGQDVEYCLTQLNKNITWTRSYTGLIE